MLGVYLRALALIFVAEMGDKTQILAMTFATKYKLKQVLYGIVIGSFLNHGLAIILGVLLSNVLPITMLQVIAGVSFLGFAFWSLALDEEEEETTSSNKGPIITVALAFFLGELGDKTQLTAIVLATDTMYPFLVLLGTVSGMALTGGLGIYIGSKVGAKIPEFTIKLVSAGIFYFFGTVKLIQNIPNEWIHPSTIFVYLTVTMLLAYTILRPTIKKRRLGDVAYKKRAEALKNLKDHLTERLNDLCLGASVCGECVEEKCIIGATKILLKTGEHTMPFDRDTLEKDFDQEKAVRALETILDFLESESGTDQIFHLKNHLEYLLFQKKIYYEDRTQYLEEVKRNYPQIYEQFVRKE